MTKKTEKQERLPGRALLLASAGVVLFGFWVLLSGFFTPFLLTAGALSAVTAVAFAKRLGAVDPEGQPIHLLGRAALYWPWLLWEIAKSAWEVTRIIVDPRLPISPTMTRIKTSQRTAVGQVIYANSITLTPGTISVEIVADEILVHALTRDGAEALGSGEMDRRVARIEGVA